MLGKLKKKLFFSSNDKFVRDCKPLVKKINALEKDLQALNEEELKNKTIEFKKRLEQGENLLDLLPEAYAVIKNTCRRLYGQTIYYMGRQEEWNMVPYDVQIIGAIAMAQGNIAEMQTGEGKTLTATMPLYLHALTGKNVQLVTSNDFLAKRDSQWVGTIFTYLGLTVGCLQNSMSPEERIKEYNCDITYATNSELGFDYLRDMGMATHKEQLVQRNHYFVIIDEIDSILIDEARTPLIISGPVEDDSNRLYKTLKPAVTKIYNKQKLYCDSLVMEIKNSLKTNLQSRKLPQETLEKLVIIRMGLPNNKQLLELLETPFIRRAVEKYELKLIGDAKKNQKFSLRKNLFFFLDEKTQDCALTEMGKENISKQGEELTLPNLMEILQNIELNTELSNEEKSTQKDFAQTNYHLIVKKNHILAQLLRAYTLFQRDVQYIVHKSEIVIVDENTGYAMPGRRFSQGLHQALEAKEGVTIQEENQTLATITIQNYFRIYEKIAGMTGTAETEAGEFLDIYKLNVRCIPTNKPGIRIDQNDQIYMNKHDKYLAIVEEITKHHEEGRAILVGTPTVAVSETISELLKKNKIIHNVLNARRHDDEAKIISNAGVTGAITIATNMAGRGTDIKIDATVKKLGGLLVIIAAKHESRRIDRQLKGRSARQGDPGETIAFVSLEDELMRLFGSDRITAILERIGTKPGESLSNPLLTISIERAQKKIESKNFGQRKRTLEYDDVMNLQRKIIYRLRKDTLFTEKPRKKIFDILSNNLENLIKNSIQQKEDSSMLINNWLTKVFPFNIDLDILQKTNNQKEIFDNFYGQIIDEYKEKIKFEDDSEIKELERFVILNSIDKLWKDHLHAMDDLRQNVQFSVVAQKDPLITYKNEAYQLFNALQENISEDILSNMFRSFTSLAAFENFLDTSIELNREQDNALPQKTETKNQAKKRRKK